MSKQYSAEEKKQWGEAAEAKREELFKKLEEGVLNLATDENWRNYLVTAKKFPNYSINNQILIGLQNPEATRVASYGSFQALGRQVKKGEHGLTIFAPMRVSVTEEADPRAKEKGEVTTDRLLFKAVKVFDVSQTEGRPLPEAVKLLDGDDPHKSFESLERIATKEGLTVEREELAGGLNGYYQPSNRRIVVGSALSEKAAVKTMAHELFGHHYGSHGDSGQARKDKEVEAESVAFLTCADLNIASDQYSFSYITGWAGGDPKEAVKSIRELAQRIQQSTRRANEALEADLAEQEGLAKPDVKDVDKARQRDREMSTSRGMNR